MSVWFWHHICSFCFVQRVLMVATRNFSSLPGWTLITLANGHWLTIGASSWTMMGSPTLRSREGWFNMIVESDTLKFQKCLSKDLHNCHLLRRDTGSLCGASGSALSGLPIRKWPGVKASTPSWSQVGGYWDKTLFGQVTCSTLRKLIWHLQPPISSLLSYSLLPPPKSHQNVERAVR